MPDVQTFLSGTAALAGGRQCGLPKPLRHIQCNQAPTTTPRLFISLLVTHSSGEAGGKRVRGHGSAQEGGSIGQAHVHATLASPSPGTPRSERCSAYRPLVAGAPLLQYNGPSTRPLGGYNNCRPHPTRNCRNRAHPRGAPNHLASPPPAPPPPHPQFGTRLPCRCGGTPT